MLRGLDTRGRQQHNNKQGACPRTSVVTLQPNVNSLCISWILHLVGSLVNFPIWKSAVRFFGHRRCTAPEASLTAHRAGRHATRPSGRTVRPAGELSARDHLNLLVSPVHSERADLT